MTSPLRLPDFAVIGAQKAGSTYLLNCLRSHPQVFMPREEIAFCEEEPLEGKALERFARHFVDSRSDQVIGVKRPNVLGTEPAARWMARAMPQCKLLVILRHPVERAISGYFHYMATGLLPIAPAQAGLEKLVRGEYPAGYPRAREVLEFGLYARHLVRFRECFPPEQMRIEFLEDVRNQRDTILRQIYAFVGVSVDFDSPAKSEKPMQAPYSIRRLRIRRWLYEGSRQRPAGSMYYQAKRDWLSTMRRGFAKAVDRWLLAPVCRNAPPRLPTSLLHALHVYYEEDVRALSKLLDRPLDHWLTTPT